MAKRAVRLIGILLLSLMLLIAGTATVLWYQGKDWLTSFARSELAKSGVTLNSLAWRLESHGVTIENLNLDIEDSRLQLAGLRITFDKPLSELAFEAIQGYWQSDLKPPLPLSIALEQTYVFLGSRSLLAAGANQADDRAAMALDLNNLPSIAFGPVEIATQQGKLLRLDYLSLGEDRRFFSRIANPNGDKVLDLNATLATDAWHTELGLWLPASHRLLQDLAATALPIAPENPLFGFLQQLRQIEAELSPSVSGELKLSSSLTLKTAALASELSLKDASLTLGKLDKLKLDLADTGLKANIEAGIANALIEPVILKTELSQSQRAALLAYIGKRQGLQQPFSATDIAPLDWASKLDAMLFDNHPLSVSIALPEEMALASGEPVSTKAKLSASAGAWQLGVDAEPLLGSSWQSPLRLNLSHSGPLDVGELLSGLGLKPTGPSTEPSLETIPEITIDSASLAVLASVRSQPFDGEAAASLTDATANSSQASVPAAELHLQQLSLNLDSATAVKQAADSHTQLGIGQSRFTLEDGLSALFTPAEGDLTLKFQPTTSGKQSLNLRINDISASQNSVITNQTPPDDPKGTTQASTEKRSKLEITELTLSSTLKKPLELVFTQEATAQGHKDTADKNNLGSNTSERNDTAEQNAAKKNTGEQSDQEALIDSLLLLSPELESELTLSHITALNQLPRSQGSKRLKTTRFKLPRLSLNQQLSASTGLLTTQERWQLGEYQPIRLSSEHRIRLTGSDVSRVNASWQGQNSLGDWREALAGSLELSSDLPLSGETRLSAEIELDLSKQTTDIHLEADFSNLEGSVSRFPFHGGNFNAGCALHQDKRRDSDFRLGCDKLSWSLAEFQPGIILTDLSGQGTMALQSAEDGTLSEFDIDLTSRGKLLEGEFLLPLFKLNLKQPSHAYLVLTGLSLEELLALQPVEGIKADGLFDGVLPVDMRGGKVSVSGGRLAARAPGGLIEVSNNPAVDELVASQPHLALVFDALKHLEYSSLAGSFDMEDNGDALINVEVKGKSEGIERPIHLNYSHEENLLQLIRSLTISDKLQSHIEQSVN